MFSPEVYGSWKEKQIEKYRDLVPLLKEHIKPDSTLLDIGIGKGWFEELLLKQGFTFSRMVGVDIDEKSVEPRVDGVEYVFTPHYTTDEKFDFVVCFDSAHLLESPERIVNYSRGSILVSSPLRLNEVFEEFPHGKIIKSGLIGEQEKDWFIFLKA